MKRAETEGGSSKEDSRKKKKNRMNKGREEREMTGACPTGLPDDSARPGPARPGPARHFVRQVYLGPALPICG